MSSTHCFIAFACLVIMATSSTTTRKIPVHLISSDRVDEAFDICLEQLNAGTIARKDVQDCLMKELKRMAWERNQEILIFPTSFDN